MPDSKPVVTVSIDVMLGGYTGQREQWEQYTESYKVYVGDDVVTLSTHNSIPGRQIQFSKSGLLAALEILKDYQ